MRRMRYCATERAQPVMRHAARLAQPELLECPHRDFFARRAPGVFFRSTVSSRRSSSERLAMIRRIRAFSSSTARARASSLLSMPPYLDCQLAIVFGCTPWRRPRSTNDAPGVVLFEDRDDLRLGEARLPHKGFLSAILDGETHNSLWPDFQGRRRFVDKQQIDASEAAILSFQRSAPFRGDQLHEQRGRRREENAMTACTHRKTERAEKMTLADGRRPAEDKVTPRDERTVKMLE